MTSAVLAPASASAAAKTTPDTPTTAASTTHLYVEVPRLELRGVSWESFREQQQEAPPSLSLKEYVWKHCQDQVLSALRIECADASTASTTVTTNTCTSSSTASSSALDTTISSSEQASPNHTVSPVPPCVIPSGGERIKHRSASSPLEVVAPVSPDLVMTSDGGGATGIAGDETNTVRSGSDSTTRCSSEENGITSAAQGSSFSHGASLTDPKPKMINKNNDSSTSNAGVDADADAASTNNSGRHHRDHSDSNSDKSNASVVHLEWMQQDLVTAARKLKLLEKLADVQRQYLDLQGPNIVFRGLLTTLLEIMQAEYGFVGEVKYKNNNYNPKKVEDRYLHMHALTNIAWDAASTAFYRDNVDRGLAFYNSKSLFGHVMMSEEPLISNTPSTDPRRGGTPPGHPPVHTFLCVPFFNSKDGSINGMVGLANKPGGFTQTDVDFLEPCVRICGNLLTAYQAWTPHRNSHNVTTPTPTATATKPSPDEMPPSTSAKTTSAESLSDACSNQVDSGSGKSCINAVPLHQQAEHEGAYRQQNQRIQELELANIQLAQAHQQVLRQSAAQLRHFACSSHEIRQPLNCIIGLSSLLQETELNPMQSESMQLITSSSELLLTVVNDVLDYSKMESGHVDVKIQPSNMQEMLLGVVHSMELKARDKNIRVRTDYSPFLPPKWNTDRLRLQQILFNLLGNAFKFSEPNSCIDLKVQLGPPGRPSMASHSSALTVPRVLRFVVKDYGCGIHPNQLQNIFKPFVQAGNDTKRLYEGTGLGLAITSKLVQALGGCVYANSVVNVGSEFVVEFPFEEEAFDVERLGQRLKKSTVLFIPGENIPKDRIPAMTQLLESFDVDYRVLRSMDELERITLVNGSTASSMSDHSGSSVSSMSHSDYAPSIVLPIDHSYVYLVDESMYVREVMQRWNELHVPTALLTFGPNYTVAETSNHYRNLLQIVPSVLMQHIADAVAEINAAPSIKQTQKRCIAGNSGRRQQTQAVPALLREKQDISILAAEDNVINQKVLRALLKKLGYTNLTIVGDGKKAVDAVESEQPAVVLMDVMMPVMDGLEATRLIVERQREKMSQDGDTYAGPKIVFVTATVDQALEDEAKRLGAVGFVPKPFNLRQLESCMNEICRSLG